MGEVFAMVGVWSADGSAIAEISMKADTGATYCQLPAANLYALGWEANAGHWPYQLADGSVGFVGVGRVKIRYNGRDSVEYFLFGETDSVLLIGVETLQNLSLGVDPVNHRLIDIVPDA